MICTILSADLVTPHDILCINGASAALMISPLPLLRTGRRGTDRADRRRARGQPDPPRTSEGESSTLDLIVVGTKEGLTMVEAGAVEIPEDKLLEALAHEEIKKLCEVQEELGPARRQVEVARLEPDQGDRRLARQPDPRADPGRRPARGVGRRRGGLRRALPGDDDGVDRGGHPAPGAGSPEPDHAARDDPTGSGRGPVRSSSTSCARSPTPSRTRRS